MYAIPFSKHSIIVKFAVQLLKDTYPLEKTKQSRFLATFPYVFAVFVCCSESGSLSVSSREPYRKSTEVI